MSRTVFGLVVGMALHAAAGAASWIESAQGDLSNNRLAPSQLTLTEGANTIQGSFGAPDVDYLSVVVPQGLLLSAVRYGADMVLGVRSFIAVQAGSQMTVPADTQSPAGLLGWAHFQQALPGTNLLPAIGSGFGATGFSGPLPAGIYTFWVQDNSEVDLAFDFNFEVSVVPEPAPAVLLAAGAAALGLRRWRAR